MNIKSQLLPRLVKFLEIEGVYQQFERNLKHRKSLNVIEGYIINLNNYPEGALYSAFTWANTIEDHFFWEDIDMKWRDYYREHSLQLTNNKTTNL